MVFLSHKIPVKMRTFIALFSTLAVAASPALAMPKNSEVVGIAENFLCPEANGLFPDPEQCDKYYDCVDGEPLEVFCKDGYMFDDSSNNNKRCKFPHEVDCGAREFVQEPDPERDPRCPRANGFFEHDEPEVCDKFLQCSEGRMFEIACGPGLVFDSFFANCVNEENVSPESKTCSVVDAGPKSIDGFTCPSKIDLKRNGITAAHPLFPHPTDCQFYFSCFFGLDVEKRGCPAGSVFDDKTLVCQDPKDVPACACWYACEEDSACPETCNADCTCPSADDLVLEG